jgi:tetratricopeptide (TPR) repeat protein
MRASHLASFLLGAAATAVTTCAIRADDPAPAAGAPATPDPRVAEILARVDALDARLTRDEGSPGADADPALLARLDELEQRVEAKALDEATSTVGKYAVSETQRIRAVYLGTVPAEVTKAIDAWTAVAEGTADPERQAEAYYEIGGLYLKLNDPKSAGAAYEKVVDRLGLGSPRGQFAAHRHGLCLYWGKDYEAAYRAFRRLAGAPTLIHSTAPTIRHWAASLAARVGDTDYARPELRRFIDDYDREGYEALHDWVESSRKLLSELE